ncbi:hypothetical protein OOZ15_11930 [Galbibacter sp. EGI 63066]|uniref:hypothetical protein n=1 Tax=Galbibacter sp. EGI 63066 TaxID=2993559 RepID=UPI00224958F6|nr:hypothetical protein [Galbibacter sp. EGI 63066]MCX2680653.1 hypothetical protein [Galbibacter sp. EGI 63066]
MKYFLSSFKPLFFAVILCISFSVIAQEEELWFGTYTDENGKILQGRYLVVQQGSAIKSLRLTPYGRTPVDFNIIENDTGKP